MTLDTCVYVLDKIDATEVFTFCQELLLKYDEETRTLDQVRWSDRDGCLSNAPDQGLPAWLMLYHRPDAPYRTEAEALAHEEDLCNLPGASWYDEEAGPCDGSWHRPACWLKISLDTAYGYRDGQGRGCGDLHAVVVAELGRWLTERGVRWKWLNEFTGDVHTGPDRLGELCSGGAQASEWFRTSVLPAILGGAS